MSETVLSGIVLGHNAFFGVDHLSAARGSERAAYFADPGRVLGGIEAHAVEDAGSRGRGGAGHEPLGV